MGFGSEATVRIQPRKSRRGVDLATMGARPSGRRWELRSALIHPMLHAALLSFGLAWQACSLTHPSQTGPPQTAQTTACSWHPAGPPQSAQASETAPAFHSVLAGIVACKDDRTHHSGVAVGSCCGRHWRPWRCSWCRTRGECFKRGNEERALGFYGCDGEGGPSAVRLQLVPGTDAYLQASGYKLAPHQLTLNAAKPGHLGALNTKSPARRGELGRPLRGVCAEAELLFRSDA